MHELNALEWTNDWPDARTHITCQLLQHPVADNFFFLSPSRYAIRRTTHGLADADADERADAATRTATGRIIKFSTAPWLHFVVDRATPAAAARCCRRRRVRGACFVLRKRLDASVDIDRATYLVDTGLTTRNGTSNTTDGPPSILRPTDG